MNAVSFLFVVVGIISLIYPTATRDKKLITSKTICLCHHGDDSPLAQYGVLSKGRCELMLTNDYIWAYSSISCDISAI